MTKGKLTPTAGKWLHEAIMGALKGRGISYTSWCAEHGMKAQTLRSYTHGLNSGPKADPILQKLIDDAGRDVVLMLYQHRLFEEADQFRKVAA